MSTSAANIGVVKKCPTLPPQVLVIPSVLWRRDADRDKDLELQQQQQNHKLNLDCTH